MEVEFTRYVSWEGQRSLSRVWPCLHRAQYPNTNLWPKGVNHSLEQVNSCHKKKVQGHIQWTSFVFVFVFWRHWNSQWTGIMNWAGYRHFYALKNVARQRTKRGHTGESKRGNRRSGPDIPGHSFPTDRPSSPETIKLKQTVLPAAEYRKLKERH